MGRLTGRNKNGDVGLINDKQSVTSIEVVENVEAALDKLAHYEDLEEQGRLIELSCAVGDTVHYILGDKIVEGKVSMLQQKADKSWKIRITRNGNVHDITLDEIGRHYFLTKEEAEAKLKELEGDKE